MEVGIEVPYGCSMPLVDAGGFTRAPLVGGVTAGRGGVVGAWCRTLWCRALLEMLMGVGVCDIELFLSSVI